MIIVFIMFMMMMPPDKRLQAAKMPEAKAVSVLELGALQRVGIEALAAVRDRHGVVLHTVDSRTLPDLRCIFTYTCRYVCVSVCTDTILAPLSWSGRIPLFL